MVVPLRLRCAKEKNVAGAKAAPEGGVWTWTAVDRDSKMILAHEVGDRSAQTAREFMFDLAGRLAGRVQLTTDGHGAYPEAVTDALSGDADYAMLGKLHGDPTGLRGHGRKHGPAECTGAIKEPIFGKPSPDRISTSHVKRQNLDMRMGMRRFARLTNGFSKKLESHLHTLSLRLVHHFVRRHASLPHDARDGCGREQHAARHGVAGGTGGRGHAQAGAARPPSEA